MKGGKLFPVLQRKLSFFGLAVIEGVELILSEVYIYIYYSVV